MFRVALLVWALSSQAVASRVSSEAQGRAQAWLKAHESPDEAGMNDLKASDPNAYAIVQALLTKKSLGLLDSNHPTAGFGGAAPKKRESFQEEAEEAGITKDEAVPEVSALATSSSVPYPSVGSSSSQPYPEVAHHQDPWSYKAAPQDDDSLVNSVLGQAAAVEQQSAPADNSLSLSAMSKQEHQVAAPADPSPVEHARPSLATTASSFSLPSTNWGNAYAGTSDRDSASAIEAQPEPELSLGAVRNSYLKQAAPASVEQPAATMPSTPLSNSYLSTVDLGLSNPTADMSSSQKASHELEMSSFHAHMSSYRSSSSYRSNARYAAYASAETPTSASILSLRKQNLGNSYDSYLKEARTNRWKRAMDVTMNINPTKNGVTNTYLLDLS